MMAQTIGEKIAALRKERHVTQTELAEYLFLVPQTISKWEVGNGTPDIALLPRIADFFGISVDELFGRTALDRVKDLVLKYSVLRDEKSFREAMDCIHSQNQTINSALKNEMGDKAELECQKKILEGNEMHLLLQQGWESAQRALRIAEELAQRTGEMPFRLQRVQLHTMLGKNRFILLECRKNYEENPSHDTLCLYFEILLILGRYEEILEIQQTDVSARVLMLPPSEKNVSLWNQYVQAAAGIGDVAATEACGEVIQEYGSEMDYYQFLWILAKLYQDKSMEQKYEAVKEKLFSMLSQIPDLFENQYVAQRNRQLIERL